MNLLCLGGSFRVGSLSNSVLRTAQDIALSAGASADVFTVSDLPVLFNPDLPVTADQDRLWSFVQRAQAVLAITPIYGGVPSGAVKNLFDSLHRFKHNGSGPLDGRHVAVGAVGGGAILGKYNYQPGATMTLEIACQNLGAWVSPRHLEFSELMFDTDGELNDPIALDNLGTVIRSLVQLREAEA